jgi:hypothetical protein
MSKHSLEKHKFFPIVAWLLVIGFSLFVLTIVRDLKETSASLEASAKSLEMKTKQGVHEINFDEAR